VLDSLVLKQKLYKTIYGLSDKYNKKIQSKMSLYREEWDKKVELFGDSMVMELNKEIERIEGFSRKEFCTLFGKRDKNQIRKGNHKTLLKRGKVKEYRYSKYKGGLPKKLKVGEWKNKHIVDSRLYKVGLGNEGNL
tara:strand:- start:149 stop:556 length:408 start_codon:yes stop_codon:yes gene_type:complete